MGVADYGINSTGASSPYTTSAFQGTSIIYSLNTTEPGCPGGGCNGYVPYLSMQLNTVLEFRQGGKQYYYWAQDVASIQVVSGYESAIIGFVDNVWNFTNNNQTLSSSSLSGNGTLTLWAYGIYYYGTWASSGLPGQNATVRYPYTLQVRMTTEINGDGLPEVDFGYFANNGTRYVVYDNVIIPWASDAVDDAFVVNPDAYVPVGDNNHFFDSEWVVAGQEGGNLTPLFLSQMTMWLEYYNSASGTWEYVPNAYNFGSDTGETTEYVDTSLQEQGTAWEKLVSDVSGGESPLGMLYASNTIEFTASRLLSSSVQWSVLVEGTGLANPITFYGSGSSINATVPDGSYYYVVTPPSENWNVTPSTGQVTVNGFTKVLLKFVYLASVNFTESGLPSGTEWRVSLNGTWGSSTSSSIVFLEPNGTYAFVVGSVSSYTASPASGDITVRGDTDQTITFTKIPFKYIVTFTETGLPSGGEWNVTLGGTKESSTASSIQFSEPNGTYSFSVQGPGSVQVGGIYVPNPASGQITVAGHAVSQSIAFTFHHLYPDGPNTVVADPELRSSVEQPGATEQR